MPNIVRRTLLAAAVTATMIPMGFAAEVAYDADVVVIGAGASGTAAAWAAAEKGLKVVTLEKSGMVGGTGKFSEGIFAVESKMQRDWNYGLTKDEAFQKIMNYGHWRGNARMVRAFVDRSADTIDWMMANGVKFEKLFSNYPNGLYTWHIYEGRGAGWINNFIAKYKDKGQTLLLNTWGTDLITKDGTVTGVVATNKDGDKITVNAKATIIATGGFFANKEMREKYLRFPNADGLAQDGKTGDGIRMAWAVGAGAEGTEVQASYRLVRAAWGRRTTSPPPRSSRTCGSHPRVNASATRRSCSNGPSPGTRWSASAARCTWSTTRRRSTTWKRTRASTWASASWFRSAPSSRTSRRNGTPR